MKRVVVLGTGTDVGKTFVTVALAHALHRRSPDLSLLALKPIETGVTAAGAADAGLLGAVSRVAAKPALHPLYAFRDPISPHLAARRCGTEIRIERVLDWLQQAERINPGRGFCLVETAGGAFSPVSETSTNVDLAVALEPALWVLVVPDALGALHDARATLLALERVARLPDYVVVNAARDPDAATGSTAPEFLRLGITTPAAVVGRGDDSGIDALAELLLSRL